MNDVQLIQQEIYYQSTEVYLPLKTRFSWPWYQPTQSNYTFPLNIYIYINIYNPNFTFYLYSAFLKSQTEYNCVSI